ncbi:MAG: hypothetical protein J6S50_02270 [Oscillospiraceae bacterium]|nr:hypothetical protein [Oscillospiraceae bacterium]
MANLNYAAQYGQELANAYPYLSYYGDLWNQGNSRRFRPLRGKTVYIPTMTVTGAHAVNRDSINGNFSRNFDLNWQACDLQMDREWDTLVDPMDMDETNEVATIANITRTFNEFQKVPEMDAYMAAKLAGFASAFGGVATTSPDASNILTLWDNALAYMTNQRVNRDRVRCKMIPSVYKLLKEATGISRFIEVTNGIQAVDRNIAKLDGVLIQEVPEDLMKTAYTFTNGWVIDEAHAAQIKMLFYDPEAIAAPVVYETSMMSAPTAQSKGKYLYYERYYYDVFCLNQRQAGVYALLGSAPSLGSLTVTSAANAATGATAGDSVITVTGNEIWSTGAPVEGTKLLYCADENSAVSITYGAVPNAEKTWVEMTANPLTVAGLTGSKVITVVLVNAQTGYAIAEGHATQVVTV